MSLGVREQGCGDQLTASQTTSRWRHSGFWAISVSQAIPAIEVGGPEEFPTRPYIEVQCIMDDLFEKYVPQLDTIVRNDR